MRMSSSSADLQLRIAEIVLATQQRLQLERSDLALEGIELAVELRIHVGIG
jgi:hypothetical protein